MNKDAISVKSVTRRFGDVTAVDDLSFEVERGEIFSLLGPNGAGKTTMINLIIGLLKPQRGEIKVLGRVLASEPRTVRRQIGYVPQDTNVYLDLNALDNLRHHAALYCDDLSQIDAQIEELLTFTSLWERRRDPVRTFSGGMKRRLVLARALLHQPEVIFFDEPTLGVDVQGRFALWEHIRQQREQGKTFIISTNNMVEADTLSDRLLILDRGRNIALDTPENLKASLGRDIVSLQTSPEIKSPGTLFENLEIQNLTRPKPGQLRFEMQTAERHADQLIARVSQDHYLESIFIARPSLDDVFLHHTGRALRE